VIVRFADSGGIVDHHSKLIFINFKFNSIYGVGDSVYSFLNNSSPCTSGAIPYGVNTCRV
jgi:hypothetical protein